MSGELIFRPVGDIQVVEFETHDLSRTSDIDLAFDFVTQKQPAPKVLFDLANVKRVEQAVVRQIESRSRQVTDHGGKFRIMHIEKIKDAQVASKLALICPVFKHEGDAVRSFA